MLNYPLRTVSKCGKYLVDFTLQDGPCPVSEEHFVLTERPGSPILRYSEISRGSDIPNLFEDDIVTDETGEEFIVFYNRGVMCKSLSTGKLQMLPRNFKIVGNIYKRGIEKESKIKQQKYKHGNNLFSLQNIYGIMNGKLLVNVDGTVVDPAEVQEYTGLRATDRERLYLGDRNVYLKDGRVSVKVDGKDVDIIKQKYQV